MTALVTSSFAINATATARSVGSMIGVAVSTVASTAAKLATVSTPSQVAAKLDLAHLARTVELFVQHADRQDAVAGRGEQAPCGAVLGRDGGLQLQKARRHLQAVGHSVIHLLEQHLFLLDQTLLLAQGASKLQQAREVTRKNGQRELLFGRQAGRPRLAVEHAQAAQRHTLRRGEQVSGVEAQARLLGDERIVGRSRIVAQVGNLRQSGAEQEMPAYRGLRAWFRAPRARSRP